MDTKKIVQSLVDKISAMDYGDTITHMDIERVTGISRHSPKYGSVMSRAKRQLQEEGKMIVNVWNVGYRVLEPDEYSQQAISRIVTGGKWITKGKKVLHHAPVAKMSEGGRRTHQLVSDRTMILEAAVAGAATEVRMLGKKRNPYLPENIQSTRP